MRAQLRGEAILTLPLLYPYSMLTLRSLYAHSTLTLHSLLERLRVTRRREHDEVVLTLHSHLQDHLAVLSSMRDPQALYGAAWSLVRRAILLRIEAADRRFGERGLLHKAGQLVRTTPSPQPPAPRAP